MLDLKYSGRISGVVSTINETKIFFREKNSGLTIEEIYSKVVNDNLFDKTSLSLRKKTFNTIKNRFIDNSNVNSKLLQKIVVSDLDESIKNYIIYYYFAKSEFILHDITCKLLYNMYLEGKSIVTTNDILLFIEKQRVSSHKEIANWTESSKTHVAQHYLAIMKDFGFLKGSQKKKFAIPFIPTEVILFILFEKLNLNMNIKQILNSDDFKLFFLEKDDVIHHLEEGARQGYIRFNYTNEIYDLNDLGNTLESYVDVITK